MTIDPTSTSLPLSWINPTPMSPSAQKRQLRKRHREVMREGDTVHRYCSPREKWEQLQGSAGFVVVRDGKVVNEFMEVRC